MVGLGALVLGLSSGCTRFTRKDGLVEDDLKPNNFNVVKFQDYNPVSLDEKIEFDDEAVKLYVTKNFESDKISLLMSGNLISKFKDDEKDVEDQEKFKGAVLEVAKSLGYLPQDISDLSIHDSVLLSGKIVAKQMDYYDEMARGGLDDTNEIADKIESQPIEDQFIGGKGVCRNYADLNPLVFEVLKKINPNLKNTYMRRFSPERREHSLALLHAWNQVSTLRKTKDSLDLQVTYVDPTWLDTRIKGRENEADEVYNAVDNEHYFIDNIFLTEMQANIYEVLGSKDRNEKGFVDDEFLTSKSVSEQYRKKGFEKRLEVCKVVVDYAKRDLDYLNLCKPVFNDSLVRGIEYLLGVNLEVFVQHDFSLDLDKEKEKKLKEIKGIYDDVVKINPEYKNDTRRFLSGKTIVFGDVFDKLNQRYG